MVGPILDTDTLLAQRRYKRFRLGMEDLCGIVEGRQALVLPNTMALARPMGQCHPESFDFLIVSPEFDALPLGTPIPLYEVEMKPATPPKAQGDLRVPVVFDRDWPEGTRLEERATPFKRGTGIRALLVRLLTRT